MCACRPSFFTLDNVAYSIYNSNMRVYQKVEGFEWDIGNKDKSRRKHHVTPQEAEEVFFDPQKRVAKDTVHSGKETRYLIIGKTARDRLLFIVFTTRRNKIRVISARDLNKREYHLYLS